MQPPPGFPDDARAARRSVGAILIVCLAAAVAAALLQGEGPPTPGEAEASKGLSIQAASGAYRPTCSPSP